MNVPAVLLVLASACLASLVAVELRPQPGESDPALAPSPIAAVPAPVPPPALETGTTSLVDTLLARPLFSQTRRPPDGAGPATSSPSATAALPRMTAILIDGPRRRAIFAAPATPGGKPTVVAEGGQIGPFTVQTIEPQQVIVIGPGGKRTLRTSFDPTLEPPAAPQPFGLGAPQFPGIPPGIVAPGSPSAGYGIPQSAGAAR